ncbi:MAG: hypothetical protein J6A52_04155 [Bacilli bacterium]|nr:hypothetical protein [Bacilli bacterium]
MKEKRIKYKIEAKEIKRAVDFLLKEKQGCYFKRLKTDKDGNEWGIVIGWGGGFDERKKTSFSDGEYRICSKIAYNESITQCDYEYDFTMPWDKETGDVYSTDTELGTDFEIESLRLSKEFESVASLFIVEE